ncbi:MAG TPA: 30S ribosomal protein S6 [Dictyoglomaceae bacterium]|nr:30S ribosomal protein S6 [Dictyoglomaceae bacterium]HOL38962.1 30S ribosomal protein S6 [Dictyoglomaceae bacterium]HOP94850.1 30S ribosomal protein S6 [Dictyoglomaceae bacterium]HPP15621.1 30S ribosomal protein S6 [Dictyoglomaceae bacterium]HPU43512.1 30S ribosomal protein S6 [Dictyoglomaceae bacterium]
MRKYEILCLITPDLAEEEVDSFSQELQSDIQSFGGEIQKVDNWGKRKLAYPVKKFNEGYYILMNFACPQDQLSEFERRLKLREKILRYMITLKEKEE